MNTERSSEQHLIRIPLVSKAQTLSSFIKESLSIIKRCTSPSIVLQKIQQMGIGSRTSYRQILMGRRRYPDNKIPLLAQALDMTFYETQSAISINKNAQTEKLDVASEYLLGPLEVLSSPINTIILNLCGLKNGTSVNNLIQALNYISSEEEILSSIKILLDHGLMDIDETNHLRRKACDAQFSVPPGVKLPCAEKYLKKSLCLAEKNYELPLECREYAAFTARIRKEDFTKFKDLARTFRREVYALSSDVECDSVIHVNLNAFMITPHN